MWPEYIKLTDKTSEISESLSVGLQMCKEFLHTCCFLINYRVQSKENLDTLSVSGKVRYIKGWMGIRLGFQRIPGIITLSFQTSVYLGGMIFKNILKDHFLCKGVLPTYMCVPTCMQCLQRPKDGIRSFRARVTDRYEPRCWELNPGPRQKRQAFLTAEPMSLATR